MCKCGNARGLFESFESAMQYSGITDWKTKLVAFSTDGAAVNIANGGLKGLLEKEDPWIAFFCVNGTRLELALKDSLKKTFFATIDEMLYYLYKKSPKFFPPN